MAAAAHDVQALLNRIGSPSKLRLARSFEANATEADESSRPLHLAWPGMDDVLPDGGFPRGVVELTAPRALGGSTSLALAAVRAGQARGKEAWCAWVDPEASLYAPGVVRAGVDVTRLLVICPDRAAMAVGRTAVKVVASGAFEVIVIDVDSIGEVGRVERVERASAGAPRKKALPPEVLVRKLALAAEPSGATVLLLTDSSRTRAVPWPVALRLELTRPSRSEMSVRVAKDKRGRVGRSATIPFRPLLRA